MEFRINTIIRKYNKNVANLLDDNFKIDVFRQINVKKFKNMRDLNKAIKQTFVEN